MPVARHPSVLAAVYEEALRRILAENMPSELIPANRPLYRAIGLPYLQIGAGGVFPRHLANQCLLIRDQGKDVNRFTGQSFNAAIAPAGGLYCALQNQALMAEVAHYARSDEEVARNRTTGFPKAVDAIGRKFVLQIRTAHALHVADLSPRNSGARGFVDQIGEAQQVRLAMRQARAPQTPLWQQLFDGEDCSVARGIGLAVANSGRFSGLKSATVRPSDRPEAPGDNLVLFGADGSLIAGLWIEKVLCFGAAGPPEVYPVGY